MTKRLRHASFLNPKKIEDAAWETIYRMCHIPSEDQRGVKRRLDDLVDTFATWMTNERKQPDQTTERERIEEAHSHIHIALATIDKLGPAGRMALGRFHLSLLRCLRRNG